MIKRTKIFEVTREHLTLLSATYVGWQECEAGAPEINPKRPYGNSDVPEDVARVLGWKPDDGGEYSRKLLKKAEEIHRETAIALQICLSRLEFEPGVYVTTDDICFRTWTPA